MTHTHHRILIIAGVVLFIACMILYCLQTA